jgi:hypothetical protein
MQAKPLIILLLAGEFNLFTVSADMAGTTNTRTEKLDTSLEDHYE